MPLRNVLGWLFIVLMLGSTACVNRENRQLADTDYSGSASCRECHEKFYELWSTSHHGLAMQPITADFIRDKILTGQEEIFMEEAYYSAVRMNDTLVIRERKGDVTTDYKVLWALGGKNVYYFLTEWEGGRLQTLPLAFDVNDMKWYNNPESAIRHFPNMHGAGGEDEALSWRDFQYTFNTSCYGCHVSQLSNNYDIATNTYQTMWGEPGINCETCHGPSAGHVRACREAGEGNVPEDLKIIMTSRFTPEQHNASCAPCHAKMTPITASYVPGDRYFDNYDLITLESTDFYPDGRDLGENYTMTGWHMNPCAQNSEMHCVTCHTSSGRYRFTSDDHTTANKACTSCHTEKESEYEEHTRHKLSSGKAPKCVDCHMPMTRFGNMVRSDHSFRPPMPAATMAFDSPNACNICHTDKEARWADQMVRNWKDRDYQKETLHVGGLLLDARNGKWNRLDEILKAIQSNQYGEIYTTSFIRLLGPCQDNRKWPVLMGAMNLESPLSRSAAALALLGHIDEGAKTALWKAAGDEYRLVRLVAAQSLALFPQQEFTAAENQLFSKVNREFEESLITRADDWSAYYNLGNHYQNQGKLEDALKSYANSLRIYPEAILPLVNSSILYAVSGDAQTARSHLERALKLDPANEAVNQNYGLLMAELKQMDLAEGAFRKVLEVNKLNSTAAYNLSIMVSSRDINEACTLSKQAMDATPDDPKFAYTYAFFLNQNKKPQEAIRQLEKLLSAHPDHLSSVFLLVNIHMGNGNRQKAIEVYQDAIAKTKDAQALAQLQNELRNLRAM
jgi:tetratricopeptide (TPR) repeat protein